MQVRPKPTCTMCEAPEAKVIMLFTREHFCGRYCFSEGSLRYAQLIIRYAEWENNHGEG